jgi:hypothetical protein
VLKYVEITRFRSPIVLDVSAAIKDTRRTKRRYQ